MLVKPMFFTSWNKKIGFTLVLQAFGKALFSRFSKMFIKLTFWHQNVGFTLVLQAFGKALIEHKFSTNLELFQTKAKPGP